MGLRFRWTKFGSAILLGAAILCVYLNPASAATQQKKTKKPSQPPLPELPSGPTGRPVQPIPLDATPAVAPLVTYTNNQLTIVAPNSTLADILKAVHKQTGAEIEIPAAPERVVTNLGPGPARDVVAELLNGSRFNYILLGSPADEAALTRVVLVAKTGSQEMPAPQPTLDRSLGPQAGTPEQQDQPQEPEAEADDNSNTDDNAPEQAEPEQPPQAPDQNNVKTPQQMLQEMQQRQMQLQQQQPPGQPPVPGAGRPPGSPQQDQ